MDESEFLFNVVFLLFCMCVIYPQEEFRRLGLTLEQIFARLLGDENRDFIGYHQRRTSLNLFMHSCLPAVYFFIYRLKFSVFAAKESLGNIPRLDPDFPMPQEAVAFKTLTLRIAQRFSLLAVLAVPALIFNWYQHNWRRHPITQTLTKFANTPQGYGNLANDICNEIREQGVYRKQLNAISTLIATENWIIKTTLYNVHFAFQSETSLTVDKSEVYGQPQDNSDALQMISIAVKPNRSGVKNFHIRINALEFRSLEDRVRRPIYIPAEIHFHKTVMERFIDVFKANVALNPVYISAPNNDNDKCFACMIEEPNIKIHKQCADTDAQNRPLTADMCCTNCYCQPMWCVGCLARWFATRQNESEREHWLQQKCTCPMCRAKFCILDVSYVRPTENAHVTE